MTGKESRTRTRRRVLAAFGASMVVPGFAGCVGGDDDSPAGSDSTTSTGTDADDGTPDGESSTTGSASGAAGPRAAVETYIEAGQEGDSEAMSAIVHPDGTATTSPDAGGQSSASVRVDSISVIDESESRATVAVEFQLTISQDGDEQTRSAETTYEARTHEGEWFVYSISEPSFENGGGSGGNGGQGDGAELTPVSEDLGDPAGSVAENRIDELVVVALESFTADGHDHAPDGRFTVEVTVGNNGGQTTGLEGYIYSMEVTDPDGETFLPRLRSASMSDAVPPGETGTIALWDWDGTDPSYFETYALNINCSAASADGVYCPDS